MHHDGVANNFPAIKKKKKKSHNNNTLILYLMLYHNNDIAISQKSVL